MTGYMAANSSALFIGTNKSTQAVEVSKGQWAVTSVGGFSPPLTVAAIGADINGFVTVTFGAPGRPCRYSNVVSSGAIIPARAPASIDMLQIVRRPSIERASMADP